MPKSGSSTVVSLAVAKVDPPAQLPGGVAGIGPAASRSMSTNWLAAIGIHGPASPSGQVTRTCASLAAPSPRWVQPSWPPMWPPPTAVSRRVMASPTLLSMIAPIASRLPPGWSQSNPEPVAHRCRRVDRTGPHVAPHPDRRPEEDLDEVEQPVLVEVRERRAPAPIEAHDAGRLGGLGVHPVRLSEEQVAWIPHGVVGNLADVALGHEQVHEAIVVDVLELGMPGRGRQRVPTYHWPRCLDVSLQAELSEGWLARALDEGLEPVRALTGEVHLRKAVAGHVVARDPHPPDPDERPSVGLACTGGGAGRVRTATAAPGRLRCRSSAGRC